VVGGEGVEKHPLHLHFSLRGWLRCGYACTSIGRRQYRGSHGCMDMLCFGPRPRQLRLELWSRAAVRYCKLQRPVLGLPHCRWRDRPLNGRRSPSSRDAPSDRIAFSTRVLACAPTVCERATENNCPCNDTDLALRDCDRIMADLGARGSDRSMHCDRSLHGSRQYDFRRFRKPFRHLRQR
jgi:hypothetical protein